jgi:hypothetical protein
MSSIYDLFRTIQKRPALYIGRRSIFELQAFWFGYIHAMDELGHPLSDISDFSEFHDWLQQRLDVKTNLSWASILLFRSSDEREALDLFFDLLEEFINRNQSTDDDDEEEEKEEDYMDLSQLQDD